jgi:hypothetical protein
LQKQAAQGICSRIANTTVAEIGMRRQRGIGLRKEGLFVVEWTEKGKGTKKSEPISYRDAEHMAAGKEARLGSGIYYVGIRRVPQPH